MLRNPCVRAEYRAKNLLPAVQPEEINIRTWSFIVDTRKERGDTMVLMFLQR